MKIQSRLAMLALTAFAVMTGAACVGTTNETREEGATAETQEAYISLFNPGTKFSCTMSGPTATGRRWAFLVVGQDNSTCYRYADTTRYDPAPPDVEHCKGLGVRIGCDVVYDY